MERNEKARMLPGYGPDGSDRWAIVDTETGELLDDAGGSGYRSAGNAYAGWSWKKKERQKREVSEGKKKLVAQWVEKEGILGMLLETEKSMERRGGDERMDGGFFSPRRPWYEHRYASIRALRSGEMVEGRKEVSGKQ